MTLQHPQPGTPPVIIPAEYQQKSETFIVPPMENLTLAMLWFIPAGICAILSQNVHTGHWPLILGLVGLAFSIYAYTRVRINRFPSYPYYVWIEGKKGDLYSMITPEFARRLMELSKNAPDTQIQFEQRRLRAGDIQHITIYHQQGHETTSEVLQ